LRKEDNERLTRVGPGTPMGQVLREYWHPIARSDKLVADGAPERIELLGETFVAFRSTDGRVGVFDEACPHRCASLALARNEGNGLRCIFHGWKYDVSGVCVDVPTEPPERRTAFAAQVRLRHYPVREAGGIVWTCIKGDGQAPIFPDFEFADLPPPQIDARKGIIRCNWLQLLESVLDSAHLSFLHSGLLVARPTDDSPMSQGMRANFAATAEATTPQFEIDEKPYGFREGALRTFSDGRRLAKIREFVAPYFSFLPGFPEKPTRRILVMSVPINDVNCAQWVVNYRTDAPYLPREVEDFWKFAGTDPDNFLSTSGGFADMWGQNRKAMRSGHFSGFPNRHFFEEDVIVQESMGRIVDRSREHLGPSDRVIMHVRRNLLESTWKVAEGGRPWGMENPTTIDYASIRSCAVFLQPGQDWRAVNAFDLEKEAAG
jgi:phthalate 4,5-dioxygenase